MAALVSSHCFLQHSATARRPLRTADWRLRVSAKHVHEKDERRAGAASTSGGAASGTAKELPAKTLLRYERKGHVVTRQIFNPSEFEHTASVLLAALDSKRLEGFKHRVSVLCPHVDVATITNIKQAQKVLREESQEDVGFLQVLNLHRDSTPAGKAVMALCKSPQLASVAAQLLGVKRVRLYQSCFFLKEPGMGPTNWHSDLNMVPLDTNGFVTAWIPLRSLTEEDAALQFASGSHRDFALQYWYADEKMGDLKHRDYTIDDYPPLKLGDATWHSGWAIHYSPGQPEHRPARVALAVSFFADGAKRLRTNRLRKQPHKEDVQSYSAWLPLVKEGRAADHPLLPIVHPPEE